jgi:NAD(P)-dependent dehydrogenase (short-subunit alcohol dehydrogenase family)
LDGKGILITGGATGIGRATALRCAQEGAAVCIGDVNRDEGMETVDRVRSAGGTAHFLEADVSRDEDVAWLAAFAERGMGRIDTLITAAGVFRGTLVPVTGLEATVWDSVLDVNLKGTFLAVKHSVPAMMRAGKGVALPIASVGGVTGGSSSVAYGASKGGVHGLAMTLQSQLEPYGIRVNDVCPGNIDTPLMEGALRDMASAGEGDVVGERRARLASPDGVARVLAFLASDDADYVRGTVFTR